MTARNREAVDDRIDRLRDRFGEVTVTERRDEGTAEWFADLVADAEDGYVGGGYVRVVRTPEQAPPLSASMPADATEDVPVALLMLHRGTGDRQWATPGGTVEDGETYEEAAVREVREETGIDCAVTDCQRLLRVVVTAPGDDREVHLLYAFFDGVYEGGSIDVQQGELRGAAWFADPPERLHPDTEAFYDWDGWGERSDA